MSGELAILNVGDGDTKLVFDGDDPAEIEKNSAIVTDMIRRGFVLLIEVGRNDSGPIYQRAKGFDPATREYIIAGSVYDEEQPSEEAAEEPRTTSRPRKTPAAPRSRKRAPDVRVPAAGARAVGVSRTAGG